MHSTPISLCHLQNKGQEVGGEEGEPADKEDNQDYDERLGSIDVVSERLISTTGSCQLSGLSCMHTLLASLLHTLWMLDRHQSNIWYVYNALLWLKQKVRVGGQKICKSQEK